MKNQENPKIPQSLLNLTNLLISNDSESDKEASKQFNKDTTETPNETEKEEESKRLVTLERNRLAAIKSRKKKKKELDTLIVSIRQLEEKHSFLDVSLQSLEKEKREILDQLSSKISLNGELENPNLNGELEGRSYK